MCRKDVEAELDRFVNQKPPFLKHALDGQTSGDILVAGDPSRITAMQRVHRSGLTGR